MKKALLVTSVASMIKQFNIPNIRLLSELGYKVTVATNFKSPGSIPDTESKKLYNDLKKDDINLENISFDRNPLSKNNLKAYRQLKTLIESNHFDIIHCQSPIGGVLTRIAARKQNKLNTRIIYTAHGFHFFKGAHFFNWIIYYPIEKILSYYTDTIITINEEDYSRAKKFGMNRLEKINGIGIEIDKKNIVSFDVESKREELGIPSTSFIVTSVGELNDNKNHKVIINAIAKLENHNIHYVICGQGNLHNYLHELSVKLNLEKNIHFLGYREDVIEILKVSDCFAFPSKREGLGIAAIEAMSVGLPLITSNVHGINDYSIHGVTGYKYSPNDVSGFSEGLNNLINSEEVFLKNISEYNQLASKKYDIVEVLNKMETIYSKI